MTFLIHHLEPSLHWKVEPAGKSLMAAVFLSAETVSVFRSRQRGPPRVQRGLEAQALSFLEKVATNYREGLLYA